MYAVAQNLPVPQAQNARALRDAVAAALACVGAATEATGEDDQGVSYELEFRFGVLVGDTRLPLDSSPRGRAPRTDTSCCRFDPSVAAPFFNEVVGRLQELRLWTRVVPWRTQVDTHVRRRGGPEDPPTVRVRQEFACPAHEQNGAVVSLNPPGACMEPANRTQWTTKETVFQRDVPFPEWTVALTGMEAPAGAAATASSAARAETAVFALRVSVARETELACHGDAVPFSNFDSESRQVPPESVVRVRHKKRATFEFAPGASAWRWELDNTWTGVRHADVSRLMFETPPNLSVEVECPDARQLLEEHGGDVDRATTVALMRIFHTVAPHRFDGIVRELTTVPC